jgi:O-antigen ligase
VVVNGVINRDFIYTGWGIHNNLGFLLAMMIPSAFFLAAKYRRGWIGTVVGSVFLIFVFLTCSRSSILGGCLVYGLCVGLMLHYAKNRRHNTIALVIVLSASALIILLFHDSLYLLFSDLLQMGADPSHRNLIYAEGLKLFADKPILGNSFFSPGYQPWDWATLDGFSSVFPPRWHNTVIHLLASCGIVGLLAYCFHRWQTIRLFLDKACKENNFLGCSVLVLIACSLLDCHFFNIAPVLIYSMILTVAEFSTAE